MTTLNSQRQRGHGYHNGSRVRTAIRKDWIGESKEKIAQSCPTLADPVEFHGILQARILEWVAFPFSRGLDRGGVK